MRTLRSLFLASFFAVAGCFPSGGGGGSDTSGPSSSGGSAPPAPAPTPSVTLNDREAVRFIQQATFGANAAELDALKNGGVDDWFVDQLSLPILDYTSRLVSERAFKFLNADDVQVLFWERAIHGEDQLRQRLAFALSQIVVVSILDGAVRSQPETFGTYADLLQLHALGNYCQLIRDVSLNPSMGTFLTHLGNKRADPVTGFVPDENYARELMQLFTIGLEDLDQQGRPQGTETYTIEDVEGLASVFTGLSWADTDFDRPRVTESNYLLPMEGYAAQHEAAPKRFLGATVDVGDDAIVSVNTALDTLLTHPNVAPFISKQLIQKLVTSNPSPEYVGRVAAAFEAGRFQLSNGRNVGTGQRCDMTATAAAILMDDEARSEPTDPNFGKIRSPMLRLAQVARTFREVQTVTTSGRLPGPVSLRRLEDSDELAMNAFYSPSVFNFYRPGYVGPGTESAQAGLVTPEFQLAITPALVGYINEVEDLIDGFAVEDGERYVPLIDTTALQTLAEDADALALEVDRLMTGGALRDTDRTELAEMIGLIRILGNNPDRNYEQRARLAVVLVATSPDFLVQR